MSSILKLDEGKNAEINTKSRKRRLRFRKSQIKWIIFGLIAILIAWRLVGTISGAKTVANTVPYMDTTVLQYTDMENSISATGVVESADRHSVYSSLSHSIAKVLVEMGDRVQAGEVLCELDKDSIKRQIAERELTMSSSQKSTAQSIKVALSNYNNYKMGLEEGTNSSLISANSNVENAYDSWQKAQDTYAQYEDSLDRGGDSTLINLRNAMNSAKAAYDAAQDAYGDAKDVRDEARDELEEYLDDNVHAPDDETIANAESALRAAEIVYNSAKADRDAAAANYDEKLDAYNAEGGATPENLAALNQAEANYLAAESAAQAAEAALEAKHAKLEALEDYRDPSSNPNAVALEAAYDAAKAVLSAKADAREVAEDNYDSAKESYRLAQRNADTTLENYDKNVDTTERAYQIALVSQKAAEVAAENQLESYRNSLESAQLSADNEFLMAEFQLAQLYQDLEDVSVKASATGTVTAVYAKEGASGSGLLFVIEDTDSLMIETSVKSYDVGTVQEGMSVAIKSDATGDTVFDGRIRTIAPTTGKTAQGTTDTSSDPIFFAEVAVHSQDTGLRIGMSVRLNYIVERQVAVLSVPYEAVYENSAAETCVLAIEGQPGEKQFLREYVVTCGMENDLDIVISGENISEGLRIVNDADRYSALLDREITLSDQSIASPPRGLGPAFPIGR